MDNPLVSVIVLCYNHEKFVVEAIKSVQNQDYRSIEIIVYDDASTDTSKSAIAEFLKNYPEIEFISGTTNLGNCKAFNKALATANGKYIIDLAADDLLLPSRISKGVSDLEEKGENYGVGYCDFREIDASGKSLISKKSFNYKSGDVYLDLITTYFVNPAAMMMRTSLLRQLGGYNEELSFEDFDFWIRSSRISYYSFIDEVLVKKRIVSGSLSSGQYRWRNKHQLSTFRVCQKILELNQNADENHALKKRIRYEIKQCLRTGNLGLIWKYIILYFKVGA
jgi:glycosyltransferase involved in cell wall biosynthesis